MFLTADPSRSFSNNAELLCDCKEMCFVETPVYSRLNLTVGQSVELLCNTSLTSDIMWSYENDDPYVVYVYWKGYTHKSRLLVNTAGGDFHSLLISNVRLTDSGLYNCYDGEGLRKVGYRLSVKGIKICHCHICACAIRSNYR